MMTASKRPATAVEVLLTAARRLPPEFTEWDLSVAAWKIDPKRFGMRGHDDHPDHKRAVCEVIKMISKPDRLIERVRPAVYRLTPHGRAVAERVARGGPLRPPTGERKVAAVSPAAVLARAANHWAFLSWLADCAKPDDPAAVRDFFAAVGCDRAKLAEMIAAVPPADRPRFAELNDFLTAMDYRFGGRADVENDRRTMLRIPADQFPSSMDADEVACRQALFLAWRESVPAFRLALAIAADWFADRSHPDEAVCRADWMPARNSADNPGRWWCWRVAHPAANLWTLRTARLKSRPVNARFWLAWPAGWVRFTSGFRVSTLATTSPGLTARTSLIANINASDDPDVPVDAWCVTIGQKATTYAKEIEATHGRTGWTALFHPPAATLFKQTEPSGPSAGLFDEVNHAG